LPQECEDEDGPGSEDEGHDSGDNDDSDSEDVSGHAQTVATGTKSRPQCHVKDVHDQKMELSEVLDLIKAGCKITRSSSKCPNGKLRLKPGALKVFKSSCSGHVGNVHKESIATALLEAGAVAGVAALARTASASVAGEAAAVRVTERQLRIQLPKLQESQKLPKHTTSVGGPKVTAAFKAEDAAKGPWCQASSAHTDGMCTVRGRPDFTDFIDFTTL
jgi:hypothetical protein